jgi:pilus assembly protein CpaC
MNVKTSHGRFLRLATLLSLSLALSGQGKKATAFAQEPASEQVRLFVGRSWVINRSPMQIRRVSVADPNVADAVVVSPSQIVINAKSPGGTSILLWVDQNEQHEQYEVIVDIDVSAIQQKVREIFPQEPVNVATSKDAVVVSGRVSSMEIAETIMQVVSAAAPKVVSALEIPAPPPPGEVQLAVKFAEVDRAALSQFGVNFFSPGSRPGPGSTVGAAGTQQFGPPQVDSITANSVRSGPDGITATVTLSDVLNIFVFRPDIDLGVLIRAMQQENLLQILAEPNLLTQVGKEANFLAGGEFPYPVVQGGANNNAISIQFREFGVRLGFTPTLTPEGKIHLRVEPEVSALDFANALTISGFTIPALSTRRVQSEMDLADGQSFAIAGLVDDRLTRVAQKIPGLGDIPILGNLFRSWSTNRSKTELLVVVTPRIVRTASPGPLPPGPEFSLPFLPPASPQRPAQPQR